MNPTTFNDPVKKLSSLSFGKSHEKEVSRLLGRESLESPLFQWDFIDNENLKNLFEHDALPDVFSSFALLSENENILPFRRFRLTAKLQGDWSPDRYWISHNGGDLNLIRYREIKSGEGASSLHFLTLKKGCEIPQCEVNMFGKHISQDFAVECGIQDHVGGLNNWLHHFSPLHWFILDYNSPFNFSAKVTPDKKGKSVEWLQTRTHYVLINRHHPANDKAVMKGAKVAPGDEYIQRRAHSRRAHARILRSPRFRNKVGQTIRVKACWVGPDEWQQFGSIYKMVNLSSANIQNPSKPPSP